MPHLWPMSRMARLAHYWQTAPAMGANGPGSGGTFATGFGW